MDDVEVFRTTCASEAQIARSGPRCLGATPPRTVGRVSVALTSTIAIAVVLAIDVWVYFDAKRFADQGTPIFFRLGALVIDTPAKWLLGCLVLWILVVPTYLVSRRA